MMQKNVTFATFSVKGMVKTLSDRIEANRKEYYRLLIDGNYTDVRFNPKNGALLAIHKKHYFDPTIGIFEIPRGKYEKIASEVLFDYGMSVILNSEISGYQVKTPEGFLNGKLFDIKGIEGSGKIICAIKKPVINYRLKRFYGRPERNPKSANDTGLEPVFCL